MATPWTPERRQHQRGVIYASKPWLKSTGPRTAAGKAKVARNAYSGGLWLQLRVLSVKVSKVIKELKAVGQWPPAAT